MKSLEPITSFTVHAPDGHICMTHAYGDYATVELFRTDCPPPSVIFLPDVQVTKIEQPDPSTAQGHAAALCALYMALSFRQNMSRLDDGNLDEGVLL